MTHDELTEALRAALGERLVTVALYGSAVNGVATRRFSDVDLVVVVTEAGAETLKAARSVLRGWLKAGHRPPLILSRAELASSADVFAIELSDMKSRRRILYGEDLFAGMSVDDRDLRRQLEFELRSKLIGLRQAFLSGAGDRRALRDLAAASLSSFAVLFATLLRLKGEEPPEKKTDLWRAVAKHAAVDTGAFDALWAARNGDREALRADVDSLFRSLLSSVAAVVEAVDQF